MRALLASAAVPALLAVVAAIWLIIALYGGPAIYHGGDELGRLSDWPDRYRAAWTRPVPAHPAVAARGGDLLLADRASELRLNRAADEVDPSLSPGGDRLLFASNRDGGLGGFDLWIAPREGDGFSEAELLPPPLSSLFHDRSPSLALLPDGSALLLFTSNRVHGLPTDHDLHLARRAPDGRWEEPVLLEALSTAADERGAALHPEGDAIVFSRPGARGIELFESHLLAGGGWSEPRELRSLAHPANGPEVRFDEGGSALLFARGDETMRSRLRILRELPDGGTPWGAWILFALAMLLLLARFLASRWRGLEILYRCLLVSVLVHLLLWWWLEDRGIDRTLPGEPGAPSGPIAPIELDGDLFTSASRPHSSDRAHGESVALAAAEAEAEAIRALPAERSPLAVPTPAEELPPRAEVAMERDEPLPAAAEPLEAPERAAPEIEAAELALRADPGHAVTEKERAARPAAPPSEPAPPALDLPRLPEEGRAELASVAPAAAEPAPIAPNLESLPRNEAASAGAASERTPIEPAPARAAALAAGEAAALERDPGRSAPSPVERAAAIAAPDGAPATASAIRPPLPAPSRDGIETAAPAPELARIGDVAHAEERDPAATLPAARAAPLAPDEARPAATATASAGIPAGSPAGEAAVVAATPRERELSPAIPVPVPVPSAGGAAAEPRAADRPLVPERGSELAATPPPASDPSRIGAAPASEMSESSAGVGPPPVARAEPLAPAGTRPAAAAPASRTAADAAAIAAGSSAASSSASSTPLAAVPPREIDLAPAEPAAPGAPVAIGATVAPAPARADRGAPPSAPLPAAPAALAGLPLPAEPLPLPPPPRGQGEVIAGPPPARSAASAPERPDGAIAAAAAMTGDPISATPASSANPSPAAARAPEEIAFAPLPAPAAPELPRAPRAAGGAPPRADAPESAPAPTLPEIAAAGAAPATDRGKSARGAEEWVPWISARRGARKVEALRSGGGNERTEAAVEAGLAYLASLQRDSGGWGDYRQRHPKYGETAVGRTALALLAFLGAGHAPGAGTEYSLRVERAIEWLISIQHPETGHFGLHTSSYSHAIATYALGEAVLMGAGEDARRAMDRGIGQILRNQESDPAQPDMYGGWSYYYHDGHRYDSYPRVSVTVWQVMALETADLAGIPVPDESVAAAKQWILGQWSDRLGRFLYHLDPERLRSRYPTLPASTPGAAFILQVLGHPIDDRALAGALAMVAARPPGEWREASADRFIEQGDGNSYFWYYGTLALFLRGGDAWQEWNEALQRSLLPSQSPDGSWVPICPYAGYAGDTDDERIYTTALNVLMLEVYYRYLTPFQESLMKSR